jgi:hypothetical protein
MDRLFDRFLGRDTSDSETGFGGWVPSVESYTKGNFERVLLYKPGQFHDGMHGK